MKMIAALCAATLALSAPALGQQPGASTVTKPSAPHAGMADKEYMEAMAKMQADMMAAKDADADRAFALKMIEHHRGAIAMSKIVIKHGDDAEAKKIAQAAIDMQTKDIVELEAWLDRHGGRAPKL